MVLPLLSRVTGRRTGAEPTESIAPRPARPVRTEGGLKVSSAKPSLSLALCRARGVLHGSYPRRVGLDEAVRGSFAYLEQPGLFSVPPVEQLRLFIEGRLPAPPLTPLSGLVVDDAAEGLRR